jgi:hypothetical protein
MNDYTISVSKALKNERINMFAMVYGFPPSYNHKHQVLLCSKDRNTQGPFLLWSNISLKPAKYDESPSGKHYIEYIKRNYKQYKGTFEPRYILYRYCVIDCDFTIPILMQTLSDRFFHIWDIQGGPVKLFKAPNNQKKLNRRGLIIVYRVFKLKDDFDNNFIKMWNKKRKMFLVYDEFEERRVTIDKPILSNSEFREIMDELRNVFELYDNTYRLETLHELDWWDKISRTN